MNREINVEGGERSRRKVLREGSDRSREANVEGGQGYE